MKARKLVQAVYPMLVGVRLWRNRDRAQNIEKYAFS